MVVDGEWSRAGDCRGPSLADDSLWRKGEWLVALGCTWERRRSSGESERASFVFS